MSGKIDPERERRHAAGSGGKHLRARRWWIIGGIVGVAFVSLLAVIGVFADSDVSNTVEVPDASSGISVERSAAADVVMEDFDGNAVTIASFEGKPLVVNFWASWCAPCLTEMPGFEKVYQAHRESVEFLGVNLADDEVPALRVVAETGITYPLARDVEGEAFAAFRAFGMPTTVFLDENGSVIELYTGGLKADELEARIVKYFED